MPKQRMESRRLVVVSNRLPVTAYRGSDGIEYKRSAGGLIAALEPMLRERGGTWVGWPGIDLRPGERLPKLKFPYGIKPVHLTENEIGRYYHGFSNRTLWPLFHSLPDRVRFDRREWETYVQANARFAKAIAKLGAVGSLVWVHDYQLILTPGQLRELAPHLQIAFFLHIPFPPHDVFRLLPWDRDLLRGLLACDLVGFHVQSYAQNFLESVERVLGLRVNREQMLVECKDRVVKVGSFPLGIDFDLMESRARRAAPVRVTHGERIVLGADRLDYTKGIPERMRAFGRLLELYPEHRGRLVLLQLAVPSRSQVAEYRELKRQIDGLVGNINGRFATATWSPIRYLYREMSPEQLAALYRDADVGLVTPLRDGMNLVAKEFVASQVDKPGVLILSRLAGAAETMREAILVNPCDVDGTAAALQHALTMPEPERQSRLTALRERERRFNIHAWAATFLESAAVRPSGVGRPTSGQLEEWLGEFLSGRHLALFLDYDGTLSPLRAHPKEAVLEGPMRRVVAACAQRADTDVTVVSGRSFADITAVVDQPLVTCAGNHGLEISGPGIPSFQHEDLPYFRTAVQDLAGALGKVATDGAWVEAKGPTLTFHYRGVPEVLHADMAARARSIIRDAGFQARDAHAAVEGRPPIGWDKGQAVLYVLRQRYTPAWAQKVRVIYVGDDETDEDAFRVLAGLGATFRVEHAGKPTAAAHRLHDVAAVQALLEWLARRPESQPG